MKLPGIQYGQTQSLGRGDVGAPIRVAAAEAQATEAWSNAMRGGVRTAEYIRDDIAQTKNAEAMNVFNSKKLEWLAVQEARDEKGESAWTNGPERFNKADEVAKAEAGKIIGDDTAAQLLFESASDKANVQYGSTWVSKVKGWKDEHDVGLLISNNDTQRKMRNYDAIKENIDVAERQGIIKPSVATKMRIQNTAEKVNHGYNVRIDAAVSTNQFNGEHSRIDDDNQLSDEGKIKKHSQLNNSIIEKGGDIYRDQLQYFVKTIGLEAAIVGGDQMLTTLSSTATQEDDGLSTEEARHSSVVHYRAILNEFKSQLKKKTGADLRRENAYRQDLPTTAPSTVQAKGDDDFVAETVYGIRMQGEGSKYDRSGAPTFKDILNADGSGRYIVDKAAAHSANGRVDKESRNLFDAALTSNDKGIIGEGMRGLGEFIKYNPNTMRENLEGNAKLAVDMVEAVGPEEATLIYAHAKSQTKLEESALKEKYEAGKYDDSAFKDALEDVAPHKGWIWDSSPEYRASFKKGVENMVPSYMGLTNGNVEASYKIAMKRMMKDKGVDQTIGEIVKHPFATSVYGGDIGGADAFHDDIKSSFESNVHINGGDIPDKYSYYPANNFNGKTNPSYIVTWLSDEGEVKMMGYTADFNETEAGKAHFKELSDKQADAVRAHKTAQMKVLANSSDEAWENAPNGIKLASTVDNLKETAGRQLNRVGDAAGALANTFEEMGAGLHEEMWGTPEEQEAQRIRYEKGRKYYEKRMEGLKGARTKDWEARVEREIR